MTVTTMVQHEHPDTKPDGLPRVNPARSLAARRQDAIDELYALSEQVDASHPLFPELAVIVRKRAELVTLEVAFFEKAAAMGVRV